VARQEQQLHQQVKGQLAAIQYSALLLLMAVAVAVDQELHIGMVKLVVLEVALVVLVE
jgi:hypothetical protein